MTDSVSIEIHDRCPAGLEIFHNETTFIVNLTASGGVGDFEVVNSEKEVIILVQKHLSTISLLENSSHSEVISIETSDMSMMPISCPPTEEVAAVTNVRVGLFQPNTLETVSKGRFAEARALNFRFETCDTSHTKSSRTSSTGETGGVGVGGGEDNVSGTPFNYRIVNHASVNVAEILLRRSSSRVTVRLLEEQHLSPVQIAVIFGALSFLVLAVKKQKSLVKLSTLLVLLALLIAIMVIISAVTS